MEKYILKDEVKLLYGCKKKEPYFVDIPDMNYLVFDGTGHPEDKDFQLACEALYTISYILKFEISRRKLLIDFKVSPMEVKWELDKKTGKTLFTWTMMIMQPEFITKDMVEEAIWIALRKGKQIEYQRLHFKNMKGGQGIQAFHLGDYNNMNSTLAKMKDYAKQNGFNCDQYTHDIYLNDASKTKTDNLKTIMRIKIC
jgi:hypothetical protein